MTNSPLSADAQAIMTFEANKKSAGVAYLLWFLAGGFGGHRFYIGRTGSAVTQLLLSFFGWTTIWFLGFGLLFLIPLGIWLLIDLFTLGGMAAEHNNTLMQRLNSSPAPRAASVDELAKYAALRDSGAISGDEYEVQKRRLLDVPAAVTP